MKSGKLTNILLFLIFLALAANVLAPVFKAKEATAKTLNPDSVPPAVIAAEVDETIAPNRLVAELAAALNNIATADREIADAILAHSRSNENIAYALEKVARDLRAQRSD
jgi:hypothetical protein